MSDQWYYLNGEEQVGPYPGAQLHELIAAGAIVRETLLWTEGMPEWLPAEQIENLFPIEEVAAVAEPAPVAGKPLLLTGAASSSAAATGAAVAPETNPYAVTPGNDIVSDRHGVRNYPTVFTKRANYGLYLTFCLYIPIAIGIIMLATFAIVGSSASASPNGEPSDGGALALGLVIMGGFFAIPISTTIGAIIGYIHLHRAWSILQPVGARTTPGAAVGFLFIPFFNLYWLFVAYKGLAEDWSRIMHNFADTKHVSHMDSGFFMTSSIFMIVFQPIGFIMQLVVHSQICRGINTFLGRPKTTSTTSNSAPGGLRLY